MLFTLSCEQTVEDEFESDFVEFESDFVEIAIPDIYKQNFSGTDDEIIVDKFDYSSLDDSDFDLEGSVILTMPASEDLKLLKCEISSEILNEYKLSTNFWIDWVSNESNELYTQESFETLPCDSGSSFNKCRVHGYGSGLYRVILFSAIGKN